MKRLSAVLLVAAACAVSRNAHAQREIGLGLAYDPRVPTGGFRDFYPDAGYAGVQGKWEYYPIDQTLAVGIDLEYHYFQKGAEISTVAIPNGAATAAFTRYAWFLSALPTVRYFPASSSLRTVRPFVEVGGGVTNAVSAVLASDLSRHTNEAGFVFQPSIGVMWSLVSHESIPGSSIPDGDASAPPASGRRRSESMFGLTASVAWAFTTADVVAAQNVSYLGVQVGIYSKP